jgi:hypothetical protein
VDGRPAPLELKENIMTDYQDPAQVVQQLNQQLEHEGRQLYADGAAITENGRQRHGAKIFDEAIQDVTAKLGNAGVDQLVNLLRGYHQPADILVHLANNPSRLEKLARMTPAQANVELARIESQFSPHGRAQSGTEPAWREAVKTGGSTTEDDWRKNYADDILDDKEWSRRWDRRELRKMGRSE